MFDRDISGVWLDMPVIISAGAPTEAVKVKISGRKMLHNNWHSLKQHIADDLSVETE